MQNDIIASNFRTIDYGGMAMPLIVVSVSPQDYPGKAVARVFDGAKGLPTHTVVVRDGVDQLRREIPENFISLMRSPEGEPVILEVFI